MSREVVLTAVFGAHADRLDRTFASFARHTKAELHALVIGDALPQDPVADVQYHLFAPDPSFASQQSGLPNDDAEHFQLCFRNVCYRRWELLDQLGADYCLVVDGTDVLCLQKLPPIHELLRGAAVAACVEHVGHYYLKGQGYTSNFLNTGVTFWDVAKSRPMRAEILARGRSELRCQGDDQWVFNEVVQTRHYQDLVILPCQFNFRPCLGRPLPNWPSVSHLDGVRIYHNWDCIEKALSLNGIKDNAELVHHPLRPEVSDRTLQLRRPYRWVTYGTGENDAPVVAG